MMKLVRESAVTGEPIVRHMEYEFPHCGYESIWDRMFWDYELELPIQRDLARHGIPSELISVPGAGHTPIEHFSSYSPTLLEWLDRYMGN